MIDSFGRKISYLRLSVTDRCDLRCLYCMAPEPTFLPKAELLSLEELERLCEAFIGLGLRRLRLTGGEPLVRRGIMTLIQALGRHVAAGQLDELTLTTNGTQLARHADALAEAGVRRINVSLDSRDPARFRSITHQDRLTAVLDGIAAAKQAGLAVKINMVALRGVNEDEIEAMLAWCGAEGFDLSLIETMPLGEVDGDRTAMYLPLDQVRQRLEQRWRLIPSHHRSGGPARYVTVGETGGRLGFITPMTENFCDGCNRVRVTCTGQLILCLGQEDKADLRAALRSSESQQPVQAAIQAALGRKPKGHDFVIAGDRPVLSRNMNLTGG